jgi:hypothetical protein
MSPVIPPFDIHKVGEDGVQFWVEAVSTLDAAIARVRELAEFWPAEYMISSQQTGNKISIKPDS